MVAHENPVESYRFNATAPSQQLLRAMSVLREFDPDGSLRKRFADLQRTSQEAWQRCEELQAEYFRLEKSGYDTRVAGERATDALNAWVAANRAARAAADAMIEAARRHGILTG